MANETSNAEDFLWLLGQPSLEDYLGFVRTRVIGGMADRRGELIADWREASDRYFELARTQAGSADDHVPMPLDQEMAPLAEKLRADPHFARACETFPGDIAMVELDRMVVHQKYIAAGYAERRAAALAACATPEAVFRHCMPREQADPPLRIQRLARDRYLFSSPSTDLRPHPPALLAEGQVSDLEKVGPIAGIIGLIVGYGSNFLSAVHYGGRLLLYNGYHRAYALRAAGIERAPCLVRSISSRDELDAALSERAAERSDHYFRSPRPPMLKDYFDPALARRHQAYPSETAIEIEFKMRRNTIGVRSA